MSALKQTLTELISLVPTGCWSRLCGRPTVLPYYHVVSDEQLPHIHHLYAYRTVGEFAADVDFFARHFSPISLGQLCRSLRGDESLPARSVLLTFDDGFREMAQLVAPILKAKGVPATFFINSAFLDNREMCYAQKISLLLEALGVENGSQLDGHREGRQKEKKLLERKVTLALRDFGLTGDDAADMLRRIDYSRKEALDPIARICEVAFDSFLQHQSPYLTSEQVVGLLRDGFSIGGHSVDHPRYSTISLEEQLRQTRECMEFLEARFGIHQRAFAFPHTDAGVGTSFFETIFNEGSVDVSFGTSGLLGDSWPGHFQRFSMERRCGSAQRITAWHHARRFSRRFRGMDIVQRA